MQTTKKAPMAHEGLTPVLEPVNTARERGESFAGFLDGASGALDEEYNVKPRAHCFLGFDNKAFRSGDAVRSVKASSSAIWQPGAGARAADLSTTLFTPSHLQL